MTVAIEFRAVSKWYGQVAGLTNLTFRIDAGVTGLVGQNGAGKSTLMKLAAGLLDPSLGQILVAGRPPSELGTRRRIGMCPDIDRFHEHLTGATFVAWMLRLSGWGMRDARRRARQVLDELGLGAPMDRAIGTYSKGMRQRVKLAQAIAHEPDVLLLDEPLTGLDPIARHEVGDWIRRTGAEGKVVLVSSHVLHELQSVADGYLLMHRGRLLAEGGLDELRRQLADRPYRLSLRSRSPRTLASRLSALSAVVGIEIDAGGVVVSTEGGHDLFEELTRIGADDAAILDEIVTLDDNLESVFRYLVRG
jgi:ABC-2 type transport system ATP-binding protein